MKKRGRALAIFACTFLTVSGTYELINKYILNANNKVDKIVSDPDKGYYVTELFDKYTYKDPFLNEKEKVYEYKLDGNTYQGTDYWSMHSKFFYKGKETNNSIYDVTNKKNADATSEVFDLVDANGNKAGKATVINTMSLNANGQVEITTPGIYVLNGDFYGSISVNIPKNTQHGDVVIDLNGFRLINNTEKNPYSIYIDEEVQNNGDPFNNYYIINSYDASKYSEEQRKLHQSYFIWDDTNKRYRFLDTNNGETLPADYQQIDQTQALYKFHYYDGSYQNVDMARKTYFIIEGGVVTNNMTNMAKGGIALLQDWNNTSQNTEEYFLFAGVNIAGNRLEEHTTGSSNHFAMCGLLLGARMNYTIHNVDKFNAYGNVVNCNIIGNKAKDGTTSELSQAQVAGGITSYMFYNLIDSNVIANYSAQGGGILLYKYANIQDTDLSYNRASNTFKINGTDYHGLGGAIATGDTYINFNGTWDQQKDYLDVVTYDTILDGVRIHENQAQLGGAIFFSQPAVICEYDYTAKACKSGGKSVAPQSLLTIRDSVITENSAASGGAIYLSNLGRIANETTYSTLLDQNYHSNITFEGSLTARLNSSSTSMSLQNIHSNWLPYIGSGPFIGNSKNSLKLNFKNISDINISNNMYVYSSGVTNVDIESIFPDGKDKDIKNQPLNPNIVLDGDIDKLNSLTFEKPFDYDRNGTTYKFLDYSLKSTNDAVLNEKIKTEIIKSAGFKGKEYYLTQQNDNSYAFKHAGYRIYADNFQNTLTYDGTEQNVPVPSSSYIYYSNEQATKTDIPSSVTTEYIYYHIDEQTYNDTTALQKIYNEIRYGTSNLVGITSLSYMNPGSYYYIVQMKMSKSDPFFSSSNITSSEGGMDLRYSDDNYYYGFAAGSLTIEQKGLSLSDFNNVASTDYDGKEHSYVDEFSNSSSIPVADRDKFFDEKIKVLYYDNNSKQFLTSAPLNAGAYKVLIELKDDINYKYANENELLEIDGKKYLNIGDFSINQISLNDTDFTSSNSLSYNSQYQTPELKISDNSVIPTLEQDIFFSNKAKYYVANKENGTYTILDNGAKDASVNGYDYYLLLKIVDDLNNYKLADNATKVTIDGQDYLVVSQFTIEQVNLVKDDFAYDTTLTYNGLEQTGNVRLSENTNVQGNDKDKIFSDLGGINYASFDGTSYILLDNSPKNAGAYYVLYTLKDKSNYKYDENIIEIKGIKYLNLGSLNINKKDISVGDFSSFASTTYNGKSQNPNITLSSNTTIPSADRDTFIGSTVEVKYAIKTEGKWSFVDNNSFINATSLNNQYFVLVLLNDENNYHYADNTVEIEGKLYLNLGEFVINKVVVTPDKEWFPDQEISIDSENKKPSLNGTLPEGVEVEFIITDKDGNVVTSMDSEGEYTVTAKFKYDAENYAPIDDLVAKYVVKSTEDFNKGRFPWLLITILSIDVVVLAIVLGVYFTKRPNKKKFIK